MRFPPDVIPSFKCETFRHLSNVFAAHLKFPDPLNKYTFGKRIKLSREFLIHLNLSRISALPVNSELIHNTASGVLQNVNSRRAWNAFKRLRKFSGNWPSKHKLNGERSLLGVGFSYFSSSSVKMVQNNKEIGRDLINFLKTFLSEHEEFQKIPLYIFGESYGGKMAVEFAYQLVQEIRRGEVTVHFKGIGLGDAYISPIHYILNYGSLALNLGLIEKKDFNEISNLTEDVKVAIERRDFLAASDIEAKITDTVIKATQGIDVYNIVLKSNISALPRFLSYQDSCNQLMNTKIKESLNISADIEWNFINDDIYSALQGDLMRPVTGTIEALLNETDIKIIVYNGVFDFLVNTAGTAMWLDDLKWNRSSEWQETNKQPLEIDMVNEAYVKQVGNLVFYTVLRAGHSVPVDNIPAMEEILKRELLYS